MTDENKKAAFEVVLTGIKELTRIIAAMIALFTTLWLLGAPAAEDFVVRIVEEQKLAPKADMQELELEVKTLKADQVDISKQIEHYGAQIDNIEKLAAEQRGISNTILLELRRQ